MRNAKGAKVGLVLAWADKGRNPNSWRAFPSQEARLRYARYIAARYGAYDVYFIVVGEWNADTRRDLDLSDDQIRDITRSGERFASPIHTAVLWESIRRLSVRRVNLQAMTGAVSEITSKCTQTCTVRS